MKKVGSYEAKTHLPRLLAEVQLGETFAITKHGIEVAYLISPPTLPIQADMREVVAQWKKARKGVHLGKRLSIRTLIDEGRK